ncbi:MAG: (Fe-S)-binding protein, partial [bacterium]
VGNMEFSFVESLVVTILIILSVGIFSRDFLQKIKIIRKGKSDRNRADKFASRLMTSLKETFLHTKVIGARPVAGTMHFMVFAGFVFFALETIDHFLKAYGLHFMSNFFGENFRSFYGWIVAIWAILVSIGITGLALRRFVFVKFSPGPKSISSGFVALLILILMLTYLYGWFNRFDPEQSALLFKANWWIHASSILIFPHLILRSKHLHLMLAPFTIFFRTERISDLLPLNLDMEALESEEEVTLGLETLADLSWKQRLDFFSCVECKRCTDNCPANISGQELDPRGFILDGRKSITNLEDSEPVIGNVITDNALGQCTSCGACENICPVGIEHLQVLTGAKRAQALALGTGMVASDFLQTVERTGNALGEQKNARDKLIEELQIPIYEKDKTEYLLWLGCVWGYNPDARTAVEGMLEILKKSGTSFGVLKNETCSGHHSRRQGEEMQFQTLAGENMANLKELEVKNIIAPCPHCLHTISREYPTLDGDFAPNVIHHSQFIGELISKKAITLNDKKNGAATTYHDPCYLGRYEKVYNAPRDVISTAGLKVTEMARHGEKSMCCGGGNAGFVREQEVKKRVDKVRKAQVRETGAKLLVTACPECKMMLNAAVEETKDLAEVVADAME